MCCVGCVAVRAARVAAMSTAVRRQSMDLRGSRTMRDASVRPGREGSTRKSVSVTAPGDAIASSAAQMNRRESSVSLLAAGRAAVLDRAKALARPDEPDSVESAAAAMLAAEKQVPQIIFDMLEISSIRHRRALLLQYYDASSFFDDVCRTNKQLIMDYYSLSHSERFNRASNLMYRVRHRVSCLKLVAAGRLPRRRLPRFLFSC